MNKKRKRIAHAVRINLGGDRPEDALIDLACNIIWYIPV